MHDRVNERVSISDLLAITTTYFHIITTLRVFVQTQRIYKPLVVNINMVDTRSVNSMLGKLLDIFRTKTAVSRYLSSLTHHIWDSSISHDQPVL